MSLWSMMMIRPEDGVAREVLEGDVIEVDAGGVGGEGEGGGGGYEQEGAMVPHGEGEEGLEGTDGAQGWWL